ncbi:uncharacterized protein [Musca autumnalis]|uniref:uncharacterized protein n=1 Tax=Musca autumnalis TaxID=221902 RepID=UPI003CEC95D5
MAQNMLACRGLRCLMARCRPAPLCTWSMKTTPPTMTTPTTTTWYIKPIQAPMTAAYSKDTKNTIFSYVVMQKHFGSNAAPQPTPINNTEITSQPSSPPTNPLSLTESQSKSITEKTITVASSTKPPSPSTSNTEVKSSPPSCPNNSNDPCKPPKSPPDTPIQPPNIKLPNRDQVEKYFFTALVYVWDFCYYMFCLTIRLIDTYILKNPTLQQYWKKLIQRLDQQREAMKSKK